MKTAPIDSTDPGHDKNNPDSSETQIALALENLREGLEQVAAARVALPIRKKILANSRCACGTAIYKRAPQGPDPRRCANCKARAKNASSLASHQRRREAERVAAAFADYAEGLLAGEDSAELSYEEFRHGFTLFGGLTRTFDPDVAENFGAGCFELETPPFRDRDIVLNDEEASAMVVDWSIEPRSTDERMQREKILAWYELKASRSAAQLEKSARK